MSLHQTETVGNRYEVLISLDAGEAVTASFEFPLWAWDSEDIRWYLEDYPLFNADPAPRIAARIQNRMTEIGTQLFSGVFLGNNRLRRFWDFINPRLESVAINIFVNAGAIPLPWELLQESTNAIPLALRAKSFVRSGREIASGTFDRRQDRPLRVLLVICRPSGGNDVLFRSVASRLIAAMETTNRRNLHISIMRPPIFQRLTEVLNDAKNRNEPYDVVHFDGHGIYEDLNAKYSLRTPKRPRGYLIFENLNIQSNEEFIHGRLLGQALKQGGVPYLVLNACRSAHAERPFGAQRSDSEAVSTEAKAESAISSATRAFGSLAEEVVDCGILGVVAMRYNVHVATAAQFMKDLYLEIGRGVTLGEASALSRRKLFENCKSDGGSVGRSLHDWFVPVVYETRAIPISTDPYIDAAGDLGYASDNHCDAQCLNLPRPPEIGFHGRDETLLTLDRVFDVESIVLLHGYAGGGKSSTIGEFGRWYCSTGGVDATLFTSFAHLTSVSHVITEALWHLRPGKSASEISNGPADIEARRTLILLLQNKKVLWIWDDVEFIDRVEEELSTLWTRAQQKRLIGFLRRVSRHTRTKFLLASRRPENRLLLDLPSRVPLRSLNSTDSVEVVRATANKKHYEIETISDWNQIVQFARGNPLTLTLLVKQALHDGFRTRDQIESFVQRLRAGDSELENLERQEQLEELDASLLNGFEPTLGEIDRKLLSLLSFFQGFVNVEVLVLMGSDHKVDWTLSELQSLSKASAIQLLDSVVDRGVLISLGNGFYEIHPALRWFFKHLMFKHAQVAREGPVTLLTRGRRAFVHAIALAGFFYRVQYDHGHQIDILAQEEPNLLFALQFAKSLGWWQALIELAQSLRTLYDHQGRSTEWRRIAEEIVPKFVQLSDGGPLPGREKQWFAVNEIRAELAREARDWKTAELLEARSVAWQRHQLRSTLQKSAGSWSGIEWNEVRTLATGLRNLGESQMAQEDLNCIKTLAEAVELAFKIQDEPGAAVCMTTLGRAYRDVLKDFPNAKRCFLRSRELYKNNPIGLGRCYGELGITAQLEFEKGMSTHAPEETLRRSLTLAYVYFGKALSIFPSDSVEDIAQTHCRLGQSYGLMGLLEVSFKHYREALTLYERCGNLLQAGLVRHGCATDLGNAGRFQDALEYAVSALKNFDNYGIRASQYIDKTRTMIAKIESELRSRTSVL